MAVAEAPAQLFNWNLTETFRPGKVVRAESAADVQQVVKDNGQFPSPVLAVGAMHSVNSCLVNNGGTVLNMSNMNRVLGLEPHGVRVQAGCKMADIYDWLGKHDLELSFCPEIGDATVGSLAVTTSKDSSIDGPGYLSALVTEVQYVDEAGELVTLLRSKNPAELAGFTCSYGMMGVVTEVVLETRPRIPVSSVSFTRGVKSGAAAVKTVLKARSKCDALFAILVPDRNYVYLETRKKAKATAFIARSRVAGAIGTAGENEIARAIMINLKYKCFLLGQPPGRKTANMLLSLNPFPTVHYRNMFTNRYPEVEPGSRRLDFSYFEFNLPSFEAVLEGCWDFHKNFKAQHGFGPRGYAIYFVKRGYTPDAPSTKPSKGGSSGKAAEAEAAAAADSESESEGVLTKPYGNYSKWGPGVSFMMDPITDDADSPLWISFNEAYTAWAVSMGAIPSLSQTKGLKPGQVTLPKHLTRERFLTPYFKSFVE